MSQHTFVVAAAEDQAEATEIFETLHTAGIACRVISHEAAETEPSDTDHSETSSPTTVVLAFSQHTSKSRRVFGEVHDAYSRGVPIVVLHLDDALPSGALEEILQNSYWFDALERPLGPKVQEVVAFIGTLLPPSEQVASSAPEPPLTFHHYAVMQRENGEHWEIGRGAMGITYKALDSRLRRIVALKVISPERVSTDSTKDNFLLEAQANASLHHPHIASIYYFGEQDGDYFYAMEYIDGLTLEQLVNERGPLDVKQALTIAAQAATALGVAHESGMIHRDIKPGNIMVVQGPDGNPCAKIIDFGLAAATGSETKKFAGTPLYASPEQLEQAPLDTKSDIYSLGATLYFCLAGQPPYEGTYSEIASRQVMAGFPREPLAQLPRGVIDLVARLMQTNADQRPRDGHEAKLAIDAALADLNYSEQTAEEWMLARFGGINLIGSIEGGCVYQARKPDKSAEFAVLFFDRSEAGLAVADRVRHVLSAIKNLEAPAVRQILGSAEVKDGFLVITEWLSGTRLLSILRVRRVVTPREARLVLIPLAKALDEAATGGLPLPQLTLRDILLQPGEAPETRLDKWPNLRPVIDLLPVSEACRSDVNTTITQSSALEQIVSYEASDRKPVAIISSLAYEILGGMSSPGLGPYVPLAELSQEANSILRSVFQDPQSRISATELILKILPETAPAANAESKTLRKQPPVSPGRFERRGRIGTPGIDQAATQPPSRTRPSYHKPALVGVVAALFLVGIGALLFMSKPRDPQASAPPTATTPQTPTSAQETEEEVESAMQAQMQAARELESQQDFPGALAIYATLLQTQMRNKELATRIDNIIARLEEESDTHAKDEVLRSTLQSLVDAGHPRSTALLAEFLQPENSARSFMLYEKAANLGDRHAMVVSGLMLASGQGTSRSEERAADWFRKSADLGYPLAMRCYAEVLLDGRGVTHNPSEAARLYSHAASMGDVPAKSRLADMWRRGIGVPAIDHAQALKLFAEAADDGFLEAQANLGVMLMNGEGMEAPDPGRAVELWKDGASRNDPHSMFLLAISLFNGAVGAPDPVSAEQWMRRSARLDYQPAISWCIEQNISF